MSDELASAKTRAQKSDLNRNLVEVKDLVKYFPVRADCCSGRLLMSRQLTG